ncbi:MAG: hypothetical protein JW778_01405 [Candidatus Altiarchaeota archaeon]|nr:hypothetical protein [Candidatus Altiarchaeota archaeon]
MPTENQEKRRLQEQRETIKRALHILGNNRIDDKKTNTIVACIRALRNIDTKIQKLGEE